MNTGQPAAARYRVATPSGQGGVAVIELHGDLDEAFQTLGVAPVERGAVALRDLLGVDRGLVARWTDDLAHLLPHGGPLIVRTLASKLAEHGFGEDREPDPRVVYPEARDEIEALMLATLARAASPAAVEALLPQPRRWREWSGAAPTCEEVERVSRSLRRLIDPPTVVAVGAPNVGKSTLTNALARRAVSIVSDIAGTTRDHVGVTLELPSPIGGVVVRWIDAPGLRGIGADDVERDAASLARSVALAADLIVHCGDAEHGFCNLSGLGSPADRPILRIGTRCDLAPVGGASLRTSAATGDGIDELARTVRAALVPDEALCWSGPWRFHDGLPSSPGVRG